MNLQVYEFNLTNKTFIIWMHKRLVNLNIQSLEHRRLVADLTLCYEIVHGLINLDFDEFFKFSNISTHRGHKFKLAVPVAKCNRTKYFFSSRVVPTWNSLPDVGPRIIMDHVYFQQF